MSLDNQSTPTRENVLELLQEWQEQERSPYVSRADDEAQFADSVISLFAGTSAGLTPKS